MHPRSKHWHLIDYVIVRQRDRQDVRVTKSMCGADCWTDHRLITSKMKIRILPKRQPQGKPAPKRLNVSKLKRPSIRAELTDTMEEQSQMAWKTAGPRSATPCMQQPMRPLSPPSANTKTGSTRTTKKSPSCWRRRTDCTGPTSATSHQQARPPLATLATQFKRNCMKSKTRG